MKTINDNLGDASMPLSQSALELECSRTTTSLYNFLLRSAIFSAALMLFACGDAVERSRIPSDPPD